MPDAGYEKGFLGPSVEAFGFLVCKKGRSYSDYSKGCANRCLVVQQSFYSLFYSVLWYMASLLENDFALGGGIKNCTFPGLTTHGSRFLHQFG